MSKIIGINGFGRIGKCIFLQLLQDDSIQIGAINAPQLELKYLEQYLKHDSVHKYSTDFYIRILNNETFSITFKERTQTIHLFKDRNASNLNWKSYGIHFVFDCTGSYLTSEKCSEHDVDYVMMSAPPKDSTKTFVYGVNHTEYSGERIVSAASCTTNCITPVLKWLHDEVGIESGSFTTIHATTASQYTVDILNKNSRTNRSILNNIIPHSTGASSAISAVIPELRGLIHGTSLRVPVSNVSLVDLNIECKKKDYNLEELLHKIKQNRYPEVITINEDTLVSCDFISSTQPSIIDAKSSLDLSNGKYKLMIWYDNEWSYSAQMIRLMKHMYKYNKNVSKESYFIENMGNNLKGKRVILRVDMNVPIQNGIIVDDYRITSVIPTIQYLLNKDIERLVIVSHLGRPKRRNDEDSLEIIKPVLEKLLSQRIHFLRNGVSEESLREMEEMNNNKIYLLENIRFHKEETEYEKEEVNEEFGRIFSSFGNVFINDAFGCSHRKHFSICGLIPYMDICGYGFLIKKEVEILDEILNAKKEGKRILMIQGGSKIDDKIPILTSLCEKVNSIFLGGGVITSLFESDKHKNIIEDINQKCNLVIAVDGISNEDKYIYWGHNYFLEQEKNEYRGTKIYDIGMNSIKELMLLISNHDIIFWNGTMGWTENNYYGGTDSLIGILEMSNKKVIIGGGDTAGYINKFHYQNNFYHVSTGGGASIEYLSDGKLIGLNN